MLSLLHSSQERTTNSTTNTRRNRRTVHTPHNRREVLVERLQYRVALRLREEVRVHRDGHRHAVVVAQQRAEGVQVDGRRHGEGDLVDRVAVHHQRLLGARERRQGDGGGLATRERPTPPLREADVDGVGDAPGKGTHEVH